MKVTGAVALATWMLEHLTFGAPNEALSGDLLEELEQGRSVGWYWGEVLCAIKVRAARGVQRCVLPLVFAAGWSTLYPMWQFVLWSRMLTPTMFEHWAAMDWPYNLSLELGSGMLPAVSFLWLGLLVYMGLFVRRLDWPSGLRVLGSLSLSLNVLLIATIGSVQSLSGEMLLPRLDSSGLYLSSRYAAIDLPLGLSLFVAILTVLPAFGRGWRAASIRT
jgi:hypothetical protein